MLAIEHYFYESFEKTNFYLSYKNYKAYKRSSLIQEEFVEKFFQRKEVKRKIYKKNADWEKWICYFNPFDPED